MVFWTFSTLRALIIRAYNSLDQVIALLSSYLSRIHLKFITYGIPRFHLLQFVNFYCFLQYFPPYLYNWLSNLVVHVRKLAEYALHALVSYLWSVCYV